MTAETMLDFDNFLFYGEGEPLDEIQSDILSGIVQPRRSMFYNRQEGCGVPDRENYPNSLILQIGTRYDIMKFVGYRNANVETGENGGTERRVAMSQMNIQFVQEGGNLDVVVGYIPLVELTRVQTVSIPVIQTRGL